MSQPIPFRQAAIIVAVLALVQFTIQIGLLTKGMEYAAVSLVIDDTYYYLQTAWNAKMLGFVTFDGLHATNGVQLLWFVIIFLVATLAKSKAALLFTTLAVSFFFNGLCYVVILKIASTVKQPLLALFMASLWALQSLPFRIYSMGMENSLHALVFWCVIWQSVEFLIRVRNQARPNFWGLTIVLVLNAWTRLDSALLSAVVFAFCVGVLAYTYRDNLRSFFQGHSKSILGSGFLAGSGLIAQLGAFQFMGDSFLPVSAMIKTTGAGGASSIQPIDNLLQIFNLGMPAILQGRFPPTILLSLGIAGIGLVIAASKFLRNHSIELQAFLNLWSCLLVGEIIYYVYVALSGVEYRPYFIWYRSPSFIFWTMTGALLALYATLQAGLVMHRSRFLRWTPVGVSLLIFAAAVYLFAGSINFTSKLYVARYEAALWIAENSAPDAVFAAWNAGQLGFFSNRTFINLDGLINSVDYYERVLQGSTPLTEYLQENKVEFIVDYDTYASIPEFPVVRTFPIDDGSGRSIHIWQVSPHSSLAP